MLTSTAVQGILLNDVFAIEDPFTDIADSGYREYIILGYEAGIIKGYDDNTFRHGTPISRAQMATFSYRLFNALAEAGVFGEDMKDISDLKTPYGFKDAAAIAADYADGVNVCANLGIILGFDTDNDGEGDTYRPNDTGIRGQAATIIIRLVFTIAGLVEL